MEKIKLLRLLQSLSKPELKDLTKFIHSDYFKVAMPLIRLYDGLQKHSPLFQESQLNKPELWKKIYPKSEYSLKRLTNKMSELGKEVERFLVIQSLEQKENKYQFRKLKIDAFNQHNLYGDFKKEVQKLIAENQKQTKKNIDTYRELAELYHTFYFNAKNHKVELNDFSFGAIRDNHRRYSLLGNLIYSIETINRHQVLGEEYDIVHASIIAPQLLINSDSHPLLINLYIKVYQLVIAHKCDTTQFDEVADFVIQHLQEIDLSDREILLITLSNYLTKSIYSGAMASDYRVFKIYRTIYEEGIFTKHGHLGENTFLNMVSFGLRYSDANWTKQFIVEATPKLEFSIREHVAQLGWVYYYFSIKEYKNVLKNLSIQKGSNHLFNIRMKSLKVRTFYELAIEDNTYFPLLFTACKNFTSFLKNESAITPDKKRSYLNFISLIRTLARYKKNKNYSAFERKIMKEKLSNTLQITLKEWLIEKIET